MFYQFLKTCRLLLLNLSCTDKDQNCFFHPCIITFVDNNQQPSIAFTLDTDQRRMFIQSIKHFTQHKRLLSDIKYFYI